MNEFDPSYAAIQGPYTAAFNDYITRQLQFEMIFLIIYWQIYMKLGNMTNNKINIECSETLRKSLNYNPSMKIFCCQWIL